MLPSLDELKALFTGHVSDAEAFFNAQFGRTVDAIDDMRQALDAMDTREEWFSRPASGEITAGGTVDLEINGPRAGHLWIITRITVVVPGGANSSAVVYAGKVNPANAVHTIDDADFYVDDVGEIPIFAGNNVVTVAIAGAPAAARAQVVLRGKEVPANE